MGRNSNLCICCGDEIPEGRQVCKACEHGKYKQLVEKKNKKNYKDRRREKHKYDI